MIIGLYLLQEMEKNQMDKLIKAISDDGQIRAYFISSRALVQKAADIHNTTKVTTAALGRLLSAASMMGAMLKGDDTLTLILKGDGPVVDYSYFKQHFKCSRLFNKSFCNSAFK